MVELEYHPGIVELPRRHKWQKGVMLDQSHRVLESRVSHQRWHVVIRLPMEVSGVEFDVPRNWGPNEQRSPDPRGRR